MRTLSVLVAMIMATTLHAHPCPETEQRLAVVGVRLMDIPKPPALPDMERMEKALESSTPEQRNVIDRTTKVYNSPFPVLEQAVLKPSRDRRTVRRRPVPFSPFAGRGASSHAGRPQRITNGLLVKYLRANVPMSRPA